MNLEEFRDKWDSQDTPKLGEEKLNQVVNSQITSTNRQIWTSALFTIACVFGAILNFYGQYFVNGEPLFISTLRFSMVGLVIPFQVYAWWSVKKKYQERINSRLDQKTWLARMVEDLRHEVEQKASWKLALFCSVMMVLMIVVKWLDYLRGSDTATECIGIVGALGLLLGMILIGVQHHRKMFLIPRYRRYRKLLDTMGGTHENELTP